MTKLLVATNYRLIYWDGQAHVMHESDDLHEAHYYGITWDRYGRVYVAGEVGGEWRVRTFNRDFQETGILPAYESLSELHQALYWGDLLTVCSAGTNCLCHWDGAQWFLTYHGCYGQDFHHLNSIWCDGLTMYLVEFRNKGEPPEPSIVRICNLDFFSRDQVRVGPPIHNIYRWGYQFHTLVSGEDAGILITDVRHEQQHLAPMGQRTFLRGYARTRDRVYIGNMLWEHDREKRMAYRGDAQVLVCDTEYNLVDEILLPNCGAVAEVRVLDEPDLAHHGWPLL